MRGSRHINFRLSGTTMREIAYRYDRDGLGRLVSKKLPGAEPREVVPDRYLFGGKEYLSEDGRDEYYFLARNYIPSLPRFDRHDPKAEKYYSVSPYLPFAGNPACVIDPTGKEIILKGKERDINMAIEILNNGFKDYGTFSVENGKVTVEAKEIDVESLSIEEQGKNNAFIQLKGIIKSTDQLKIGLVNNDPSVLTGDIDSDRIDMGDISKLDEDDPAGKLSAFGHELIEKHYMQFIAPNDSEISKQKAHNAGLQWESVLNYCEMHIGESNGYKRFTNTITEQIVGYFNYRSNKNESKTIHYYNGNVTHVW